MMMMTIMIRDKLIKLMDVMAEAINGRLYNYKITSSRWSVSYSASWP